MSQHATRSKAERFQFKKIGSFEISKRDLEAFWLNQPKIFAASFRIFLLVHKLVRLSISDGKNRNVSDLDRNNPSHNFITIGGIRSEVASKATAFFCFDGRAFSFRPRRLTFANDAAVVLWRMRSFFLSLSLQPLIQCISYLTSHSRIISLQLTQLFPPHALKLTFTPHT